MTLSKLGTYFYLYVIPVIALIGTGYFLQQHGFIWQTWTLCVILYVLTGLGISAGYHRLLSHRSYECLPWLKLVLLVLAAGAGFGNVFKWCSVHRRHHQYTDQQLDPHNSLNGFWYSHILWMKGESSQLTNIVDVQKDTLCQWQVKYYPFIAIFIALVVPTIIASCWHDALGGFFVAGLLRTMVLLNVILSVNSVCHRYGGQEYILSNNSRNNWLIAIFTLGEGYHNYHHAFPYDYRNGVKWYEIDFTK